jgi:NTF2-related export protein 1/2
METQVFDVASRAADKFITTYYKSIDQQRHLLEKLYGQQSILLWNGNPYSSSSQIVLFLQSLPITEHEILSYDSQPIILQQNMDIVVQVYGVVIYNTKDRKGFSQTFVLTKQETACIIQLILDVIGSDTFRFV